MKAQDPSYDDTGLNAENRAGLARPARRTFWTAARYCVTVIEELKHE